MRPCRALQEVFMKEITTRQFSILRDHMAVYRSMVEIYERDWRNGVAAPFWEYAVASDWMDKSYLHRCRMWLDGETIVGFCFYEAPATDVYFSLRPGYEDLAPEMVEYGGTHMPQGDGARRLVIFAGQAAVLEAAKAAGYTQCGGYESYVCDLGSPLCYPLPEGFRFTEPGGVDVAKAVECCWKGFDHEAEEGPWNGEFEHGHALMNAPHATPEHHIAVMNEAGDYVCYGGMWWTPENQLAYLEPLCTVPEYRHRGLAAAALSELCRRMKPLGATHMTGGGNPFYKKIGYGPGIPWTYWKK